MNKLPSLTLRCFSVMLVIVADLSRIGDEMKDTNRELATIFDRVGLTPDEESKLRRLAEQRTDYEQAVSVQRVAGILLCSESRANALERRT